MPPGPNKLSQFWQELKRRKVIRVITVYAASAFVILELVDILAPSLGLPEWTLNLVLILLIVGFIIAIILSWIYDIHPEGGIVKTEPAHKVKPGDLPKSSNSWKIASYISFVVIVGLIVLNIIPRNKNQALAEILDKSIAVLPFNNDSPNQEMYFINGTMEEILDNLCKIEDLRVISRNSVEQYRDNPKPTPEIAEELNVSYVLEGSGQRDGQNIRLTVQLLDAKNDHHIWSESYYRNIENIFSLQSEIAQLVAEEIKAVITPQEKDLIEKIPTSNITAYDFYQRGEDELWKYDLNDDVKALDRAENYFHKALEHDSTFAEAYIGLAEIHYHRHYWEDFFTEDFLDSFLILTNTALAFDNQLAQAYRFRGIYYAELGNYGEAIEEFNRTIELNPNDRAAYSWMSYVYDEEPIKQIERSYQALILSDNNQKPASLRGLGYLYMETGFQEKARQLFQEALTLDEDSTTFLRGMAFIAICSENYEEALRIVRKMYARDTTWMPFPLAFNSMGHHQELCSIYDRIRSQRGPDWVTIQNGHRIGVALQKVGRHEEATEMFKREIQQNTEVIELGRNLEAWGAAYYDLGGAYACMGEKQKAIHYLKECNKRRFFPLWWVKQWEVDPLFENIRDEPEFKEILRDVESKYQAEHERVRQWLEENDLL